jgi:imidazolonepropionase-like amidohydrolase
MDQRRIIAREFFDGERVWRAGPYAIDLQQGHIAAITPLESSATKAGDTVVPFVMPGLVEAHAHIFLDGAELNADVRSAYLGADFPTMMAAARANLAKCTRAGITLVRDAGDRYGINRAIRQELRNQPDSLIALRAPGLGIKRPKRYGGFMARDIVEASEIVPTLEEMAPLGDDIKIILTGIIDFIAGTVKGEPQFNVEELTEAVSTAHRLGRKTFAHCSGLAGLEVAVAAGVDSIEHGFFMTREILARMADKRIAWVPTFSPVHFQWARPEVVGWNAATVDNLRRILDSHSEHVAIAHELGVMLVAGSDAGSQGVDHGVALIDELFHFLHAGVPMEAVLKSATSRPRNLWDVPPATIAAGQRVEFIALARSPFEHPNALREVIHVFNGACDAQAQRGSEASHALHSSSESVQ